MELTEIDKIIEWGIGNIMSNLDKITDLTDVIAITTALTSIKYGELLLAKKTDVTVIQETHQVELSPFSCVDIGG